MTWVVTGNCQAGALAKVLSHFVVDEEIVVGTLGDAGRQETKRHLAEARVWVRLTGIDDADFQRSAGADTTRIEMPAILFRGFHPDLVYARYGDGGHRSPDYVSAVALWAWRQGLSPSEAELLFTERTFQRLGYLQMWNREVEGLRRRLAAASIDLSPLLRKLPRAGVFMHTMNHPSLKILVPLAEEIARSQRLEIGHPNELIGLLDDDLRGVVWPVYPPVADSLGLSGSYCWKLGPAIYRSLEEYLGVLWRHLEGADSAGVASDRCSDGQFVGVLHEALLEVRGSRR